MNPKKPRGERVVNAGIGLPPALISKLDKAKGDHSRSKFAAIIIRAYFDSIGAKKKKTDRPKDKGETHLPQRFAVIDGVNHHRAK